MNLQLQDIDVDRGLLRVNQGKGQKDRVIPVGARALAWVSRYLDEARPELVTRVSENTLFISWYFGKRMHDSTLTQRLGACRAQAGIDKPGSVHIFRHKHSDFDAGERGGYPLYPGAIGP